MNLEERDCLVVMLAMAAGSTDGLSYFGLGHVFIANMTGNTVLLGAAISRGHMAQVASPADAIACYVCGVFLGTVLLETVFAGGGVDEKEQVWPRRITQVLAIESVLLFAAAVVWAGWGAGSAVLRYALVSVAAVALGLQSAAMKSLELPGIVTTYITGTWTTLVAGIARRAVGERRVDEPNAKLKMQAAVLVAYCASAAVSGVCLRVWARGLGIVPAVAVTAVALYGAFSNPGRVKGAQV
jgi:uncharacterized membrane protein YoaK (UPF0700 family)